MKKSKIGLLKRFLPYYKKYKWILFLDLLCASLTTVCEITLPLIIKQITSEAENLGLEKILRDDFIKLVIGCGLIYIVLRIIDTCANFYMASVGHIMGTKIETDMRHDLFAHLNKLSFSYYDNTKVGTLMSRMTSDLFDVTEFAHHCPEEYFISSIKIICTFIILCFINLPLTLIVFATIPLFVLSLVFFRKRMKRAFKESREQTGIINSQIEDSLLGVRVVKSFANEDVEQEKFDKGNKRFLNIKKSAYYAMGGFQSSTRLCDGIMYIVVVVAGGLFLAYGKINVSEYLMYILYVSTLLTSVRRIVEFTEQFQRGITGIERFTEIMDIEPEITDKKEAKILKNVEGRVEFSGVTFKYNDEGKDVLTNLNLNVNAGESIALVGPSGGGKTTLCSLIPRFYEINEGEIKIDGTNIKDVTLTSLRENIGVVAQDVYLFSGSVRENIAYGKQNASDEEIIEASKLAGAHDFIMSLPNGYDTYVGERGVKLSGGQKQRISIARVFLKNPPILVLDEATSALDNESERLVQKSLETLAKGRTTFTIAHRLTTIKGADRILVLTENGIEEQGSHKELLEKGGIYADLYKLYSAD
ncbi:MAG: ABC transporter ATP-binding protein [Clostridia bacterium]|nr:ABC transporter ATP-binding protein [Clostridia bacterium]